MKQSKKLKIELLWNQLIFNKHSKDVKIDKEKIVKLILINFRRSFLYQKFFLHWKRVKS